MPSALNKAEGADSNTGASRDADEFLVVNCLLPARVKRLGSQLTYLSARRPTRTSTSDCEIRGGEYVSYDRSNYQTALKVWLEPAKAGDPQAQTYAGEIYERGVGGAPDYAIAAEWYRRAAEQGYAPAQINLGQLYEQGRGVPKDEVTAINWYRRASGFEGAGLTFVVSSDVAGELHDLRDEVLLHQTESGRMNDQIKSLESQIAELEQQRRAVAPPQVPEPAADSAAREQVERQRSELAGEQRRLDEERRQLEAEAKRLEERQAAVQDDAVALVQLQQLKADLRQRQLDLEGRNQELATREQTLAQREAELQAREAEISGREAEISGREAEVSGREQQMAAKSQQLTAIDAKLARLKEAYEAQRQQLAATSPGRQIALAGPEITLIDPELPPATTRGLPIVRTSAGLESRMIVGRVDAPAGLLSLLINDRPQQYDDNNIFKYEMPISPDGSEVNIVAIDRQGKKTNLDFVLAPESRTAALQQATPVPAPRVIPAVDFGHYHALVIGNDDYKHLPKLQTAVADAEMVADVLATKYGFKVTLLRHATRYDILSAMNDLRGQLTEDDNLLIYYAGHGELDRANMRGNWLPIGAEADSTVNWISNIAVTDILNVMAAKHVLVVADSCYSGTLTRAALAHIDAGMPEEARTVWLRAMVKKRSRTALTSGGLAPVLDGGGGGHSVFARAMVDALQQNDGVLEGQHLFEEVSAMVTYVAEGLQFDQTPQYAPIKFAGHEAGDFFFVPKAGQLAVLSN